MFCESLNSFGRICKLLFFRDIFSLYKLSIKDLFNMIIILIKLNLETLNGNQKYRKFHVRLFISKN